MNLGRFAAAADHFHVAKRQEFADAHAQRLGHRFLGGPARGEGFFGFGTAEAFLQLAFGEDTLEECGVVELLAQALDVDQVNAAGRQNRLRRQRGNDGRWGGLKIKEKLKKMKSDMRKIGPNFSFFAFQPFSFYFKSISFCAARTSPAHSSAT